MNDALLTSRFRSAFTKLVRGDAVPELDALTLVPARIVNYNPIDGRVSLQIIDRSGKYADTLPVHLWSGTAGVSVEPAPGQEVRLAFSQADKSDPVAFLASPKGQPGHVPLKVRHEAITEIRVLGESAGIMRVGPGATQQVALGPALDALQAALATFATSTASAITVPQVAAAATALGTALSAITVTKALKLEAI